MKIEASIEKRIKKNFKVDRDASRRWSQFSIKTTQKCVQKK